jgi:putative tricarboxylic transport membrane protein
MNRINYYWLLPFAAGVWAIAAVLFPASALSQSEWKPDRTVEIIAGTGPGSAPDQMARAIQDIFRASRLVQVPTTVINKVGGGGSIGWAYVNQHAGNGHYLMIAAGNLSVGHLTGASTIGDRDLTPICLLFHEYIAFSVRKDSPIKDGRDLLERLRKEPGSVSLAVSSVAGSMTHIAAALVLKTAGVDVKKVRTVVFSSAGKSMSAMLGDHVDVTVGSMTASLTQLHAGNARILGYTAPRRLGADLATIPTWREQGADMDFSNYRGIIGPRGLSAGQISYWENVFANLDKDERWRADLTKNNVDRVFMNSRETRQYWEALAGPIRLILDELGLVKKIGNSIRPSPAFVAAATLQ